MSRRRVNDLITLLSAVEEGTHIIMAQTTWMCKDTSDGVRSWWRKDPAPGWRTEKLASYLENWEDTYKWQMY